MAKNKNYSYQVDTPAVPIQWRGEARQFAIGTNELFFSIFNQVAALRRKAGDGDSGGEATPMPELEYATTDDVDAFDWEVE